MTVTYKKVDSVTIGGAGKGNTYQYEVTREYAQGCFVTTLSSCARDVAFNFNLAGMDVPAEIDGPYDSYGHQV